MKNKDTLYIETQNKIGRILLDLPELTLRDICGILDMTKHYFLMEKWGQLKLNK